jgi:hypothetical protein
MAAKFSFANDRRKSLINQYDEKSGKHCVFANSAIHGEFAVEIKLEPPSMDVSSLQPLVKPPTFLLSFVVLWLVLSGGRARVAGWANLAAKFRRREPFLGERFTSVSEAMGRGRFPVGYRSCLTVVAGRVGFSIAVLFPFRFLGPPRLIPWLEVRTIEEGKLLFVQLHRCALARSVASHFHPQPGGATHQRQVRNCASTTRALTPPSSGRSTGRFGPFAPRLMSNLRPQNKLR